MTSNAFMDRLCLTHPIIQAPMAGVSTPALAAAVCNAGALGSLGIGASTATQAQEAITQTRALTGRPFNVNVFCHAPAQRDPGRERAWLDLLAPLFHEVGIEPPQTLRSIYPSFREDPDAFAVLMDARPAMVSFHFGLPTLEQIRAMRAAGMLTLANVTCLAEAAQAESAGVDALVAQGVEAGGHRGTFATGSADERLPTQVLLRQLASRTRLPIVAAGGIMDGAGIRAVLDLGAVAAQLGTAFLLCPESATGTRHRQALAARDRLQTRLTRVVSGRPARGIVDRLIDYAESRAQAAPPDYPVAYDAAKQLAVARTRAGRDDVGAFWAGQGASLVRDLSAADLVAQLVREFEDTR